MDLKEFFNMYPKVALGFSGGVDSSYLLYAAKKCGADIKPYYVKGPFQAEFELQDAVAIARFTGAENMTILHVNALEDEKVTANDPLRCYHCKCKVFGAIKEQAAKDGYEVIIDGTNASDDLNDRTGSIALRELKWRSPTEFTCRLSRRDFGRLKRASAKLECTLEEAMQQVRDTLDCMFEKGELE